MFCTFHIATKLAYSSFYIVIRNPGEKPLLKVRSTNCKLLTKTFLLVHVENLFRVVAFAENRTDCRRSLQLEYFGEKFDRKLCLQNRGTACDNCLEQGEYDAVDLAKEARAIVTTVKQICGDGTCGRNFTMLHFVDVFKGSAVKKVMNEGHNNVPLHGMGKSWARLDVERLFRRLIMDEYLKERLMVKEEGITFAYLNAGRRAEELLKSSSPFIFHIKKKAAGREARPSVGGEEIPPDVAALHAQCYEALRDVLEGIATALNSNINALMNVNALRSMAASLPETPEEMLNISHVTQVSYDFDARP